MKPSHLRWGGFFVPNPLVLIFDLYLWDKVEIAETKLLNVHETSMG